MFFLKHSLTSLLVLLVASALGCSDPKDDAPLGTPGLPENNDAPDAQINEDTGGVTPEPDAGAEDVAPDLPPDPEDVAENTDVETPEEGDVPLDQDVDPGEPGGECDPFAQDCPEGDPPRQCSPIQGTPTCVTQPPVPLAVDEACMGGDCGPGLTCITWSDGRGQICTQMCPPGDPALCAEGYECSAFIRSNPAIGLCRPSRQACDIYAQDCAEEGFACTFGFDPATEAPIFVCEPEGPNDQGEVCSGGNGRCKAGLVCIRDDPNTSTCHKVCQSNEECDLEGQSCIGRSTTWQVTFCRE